MSNRCECCFNIPHDGESMCDECYVWIRLMLHKVPTDEYKQCQLSRDNHSSHGSTTLTGGRTANCAHSDDSAIGSYSPVERYRVTC